VSAPGFPAVDTPFEQMKARARSTGKPAILYFCADWCGYCTKMNRETLSDPAVQRRIAEFPATLYDSGTPVGRAVANRYGIDAYPTMVLIDASGQEVDQIIGARPPAEFLAKLARH
jgi:thiol:disulfide interchange protein